MSKFTIANTCGISGMASLHNNSVDMVLADIPYGEVSRESKGLRNLNKSDADIIQFSIENMVEQVSRVCSGTAYIFCGIKQISKITSEFEKYKMSTRLGLWEKTNPSPMNGSKVWLSGGEFCVIARKPKATFNYHCVKPIWKFPVGKNTFHPTQKPANLMRYIIEASSNFGDTVLDFTMGSGSTGVAALSLGRNFLGYEISKEYYDVAQIRLAGETGISSQINTP